MNVSVLEHPTSAPVVVTAGAGTINVAHTQFARFVDAWLDLDELTRLAQVNRTRSPVPAMLAQFTLENFCNDRLNTLYQLGISGYVIGKPAAQLVARICAPILGYVIVDTKHGQLRLQDQRLYLGNRHSPLTPRLTLLCRALLEARGATVSQRQLYDIYSGATVELNTHTLQTQIYRLRSSFARLGLPHALPVKSPSGYRLVLD